ncbi:MAG: PIG-L family deacetylase, partial [Bacteroidales bacterium]|nr:PIG-L family deacetylase [Bacteroidales bacterium]
MFSRRLIYTMILAVAALTVGSVVIIWTMRARSYEYDVRQDYYYNLQDTQANISDIKLVDGRLVLPTGKIYNHHSIFLKINLRSKLTGKFFQPRLVLKSEKLSLNQYFEHGASGVRFINISQLLPEAENIFLEGKHLKIKDENIQLISFKNDTLKDKRILVISPHPDDAEIAAFGLYSTYNDSYIITLTAGDAGEYLYKELFSETVEHYLEKGRIRTWNSLTVPLLGGIKADHILNLGFFDGTLMQMSRDENAIMQGIYTGTTDINTFRKQNISMLSPGLSGVSNWSSLIDNLVYLLEEIDPDIIVTPLPAIDYNNDHKYGTKALIQAIKRTGLQEGNLYFYTNGSDISRFYPLGKTGSIVSLPPNFNREIYFGRIYSHPVSPEMQIRKVLALDAMNDLRPNTEWRFYDVALKRAIRTTGKEIFN